MTVPSFQVLGNETYYQNLARLSGVRRSSLPSGNKGGRHFESVYSQCLDSLGTRVPQITHNCRDVFSLIETDASEDAGDSKQETIRLDGKKTVYKNDGKAAKAKKEVSSNSSKDPWGLSSAAVKTVYKKMKCPPLEMFHWKRLVVDE